MKSKLEILSLESKRIKNKIYTTTDLENLSSVVLYTGDLPSMGAGGCIPNIGDSYLNKPSFFTTNGAVELGSVNGYEPIKLQPTPNLTIRDFPNLGFQLHIHEENGGYTHLKFEKGKGPDKYFEINSYDAAMADGGQKAYGVMANLERLNKKFLEKSIFKDLFNNENGE